MMQVTTFILSLFAVIQLGTSFQPSIVSTSKTALSATYSQAELKDKFQSLKEALPKDKNVVKAGGWYNLQQLSGDPKGDLVRLIVDGLKDPEAKGKSTKAYDEALEALVTLLYAHGKGFEADLVDGEWASVLARQGSKILQKTVGEGQPKDWTDMDTYDIDTMTFEGNRKVLRKGVVYSKKKYSPSSEAYSKTTDGKIVLRRIDCEMTKATFKFWKLPTLSLPKKKGLYLDFWYLDKDIRILKAYSGGLYIHFRPDFLSEQLAN